MYWLLGKTQAGATVAKRGHASWCLQRRSDWPLHKLRSTIVRPWMSTNTRAAVRAREFVKNHTRGLLLVKLREEREAAPQHVSTDKSRALKPPPLGLATRSRHGYTREKPGFTPVQNASHSAHLPPAKDLFSSKSKLYPKIEKSYINL